ncbi:MAG: PAS domain S-box protein [Planctomycetia bacterium]|nr:PAS domain S-box protein [Planctomycetia bacterium]
MPNPIRRLIGSLRPRRGLSTWLATEREVAGILAGARGLAESAPRVLAAVAAWLDVDVGALWLIEHHTERLRAAYVWRRAGAACPRFEATVRDAAVAKGQGLAGVAWAALVPVHAAPARGAGTASDPLRVAALADGLRGGVAFPVRAGDRFHGVLEFASARPLLGAPERVLALEVLGETLGQFVARQSALQRLRASDQQLTDLFENAPLALRLFDGHGRILRANQAELEMLGYAREAYVGRSLADLHVDRAALDDLLARLRRGEEVRGVEAEVRRADGARAWLRLHANGYFEDGRLVHVRCFSRDVTDEREADLALRGREARLRQLVDGARGYALHTCDPRGRVVAWSDGAVALFGYPDAAARDLDVGVLFAPEARAAGIPARVLRLAADEGRHRYEGWLVRRDGSRFWGDATFEAVHDARGRLAHVCQLTRDATEDRRVAGIRRRTAELVAANAAVLAAQQRDDDLVAALRRALEVPVAAVERIATALAEDQASTARDAAVAAGELRRALARAGDPAALASAAPADLGPVDLGQLLAEVRDLVADAAAERRIRVEGDVDRELGPVATSADRLRLVLYNLTAHAVRACRDHGRVTVRALPEGDADFRVEVEDTGVGADEGAARAFVDAPATDGGAGPAGALRATRRVVAELRGRLAVRSTPGRGTVVSVVLPRRGADDAVPAPHGDEARAPARRLLVVAADAAARAKLAWTFGAAGCDVTSVGSSVEGVALARETRFDVVAAPGVGGDQPLAEVVASLRAAGRTRGVPRIVALVPGADGAPGALLAADVLRRPLTPDRAFATLERLRVARGRGRPVLVVDGDLAVADGAARLLEALGYRAVAEPDADAALRQAAHEAPSAVFLAPTPQTMGAFEFAHHLRRQRGCAEVPLVLLWPLVLTDEEDAALRAAAGGAAARLEDVVELLDAVGATAASGEERRDGAR